MNRIGQQGPVSMIIILIVFVIIWFVFLASFVSQTAQEAIGAQHISGVEAFVMANLNLFIMIGLIIGTMAFLYFAGE